MSTREKLIWNEAGWQLMINLILNVERLPATTLHAMRVDLCDRDDEKIVRNHKRVCPLFIVAKLSGMHQRTLKGYADMFRQGKSPMLMEEYVSPTGRGTPVVESAQLPECLEAPSELVAIGTSEDYDEMWIDEYLEGPRKLPATTHAKLKAWRAHPNFLPGMRLAELATQWLVNGNSRNQWPEHMAWLRDRTPGAFGTINHSKHFLNGFLVSLIGTAHTCISSSIHAIVPATGLPSIL